MLPAEKTSQRSERHQRQGENEQRFHVGPIANVPDTTKLS
jgi:hypothetical protein